MLTPQCGNWYEARQTPFAASMMPLQPVFARQVLFRHLFAEGVGHQADGSVEGDVVEGDGFAADDHLALEVDDGGGEEIPAHAHGVNIAAMGVEHEQIGFFAALVGGESFAGVGDHSFFEVVIDDFVDRHLAEAGGAGDFVDGHGSGVAHEGQDEFSVPEFQGFQ